MPVNQTQTLDTDLDKHHPPTPPIQTEDWAFEVLIWKIKVHGLLVHF